MITEVDGTGATSSQGFSRVEWLDNVGLLFEEESHLSVLLQTSVQLATPDFNVVVSLTLYDSFLVQRRLISVLQRLTAEYFQLSLLVASQTSVPDT